MNSHRTDQWKTLLSLLEEVDGLQQTLLGDKHPETCHEYHLNLMMIIDDIINLADEEGITLE